MRLRTATPSRTSPSGALASWSRTAASDMSPKLLSPFNSGRSDCAAGFCGPLLCASLKLGGMTPRFLPPSSVSMFSGRVGHQYDLVGGCRYGKVDCPEARNASARGFRSEVRGPTRRRRNFAPPWAGLLFCFLNRHIAEMPTARFRVIGDEGTARTDGPDGMRTQRRLHGHADFR